MDRRSSNHRRRSNQELLAQIEELENKIDRRSRSSVFDCYTRSALDDLIKDLPTADMSVVYFDVDDMKRHNTVYGKTVVNDKIRASIAGRSLDMVVAQWFSGDEFVCIIPSIDALGYARRTQERFHSNDLTATFVILELSTPIDTTGTIDIADNVCAKLKERGIKNIIGDYRLFPERMYIISTEEEVSCD